MDNVTLQNINIEVAGRKYNLNVRPDQEEVIRKAAVKVNNRIAEYKEKGSKSDVSDILALIAVEFASASIVKSIQQDETPLVATLERLSDELDDIINDEL